VVSHQFWAHRLGASPHAIGSTITLQGVTLTVVGVTPAWFRGLQVGEPTDLTVPLGLFASLAHVTRPDYPSIAWLVGRRAPGVTTAQAEAVLQTRWPVVIRPEIPTWFAPEDARAFAASRLEVTPAATGIAPRGRDEYESLLVLLVAAAVLVVGLACANVSTLLLAQSAARERELGIRAALGASPSRLVRLVFGQAVRLSVLGTVMGLAIAIWSARALASMMWSYWDSAPFDFTPDRNVIGAVAATGMLVALVVAVFPALRATRSDLMRSVRSTAGASARTRRWGHRLLIVQVAGATVLLVAGWVVAANVRHLIARPGFAVDDVTFITLDQRPGGYPEGFDIAAYDRRLTETATAIPGIRAAGLLFGAPFGGARGYERLSLSPPTAATRADASYFLLSPGVLNTLDMRLVQGRDFAWTDDAGHPRVVIVSAALARSAFGNASAIGRRLHFGNAADGFDADVVGVAADARLLDLHANAEPIVYSPIGQEGGHAGSSPFVVIRAETPASAWISQLRTRIQSLGQDDVADVDTMPTVMRRALLPERLIAIGGTYFAVLAGLITALGLSGLLAYSVASRTREIGIRSAIGGSSTSIRWLIVREAMTTVLTGLAIGLAVAGLLTKVAARSPVPLGAFDPAAFAGAALLTILIGFAAAWLPARRATAIVPLDALKSE
jgi:predicted permease